MPYKKRSKTKESESDLGFFATRFARHLGHGLEMFGEHFSEFNPHYICHEAHGKGLLFSQVKEEIYGIKQSVDHSVIAFETGIMWSSGETICFSNEQTPERVALLFLCAMTKEDPILANFACPHCRNKEKE